ncbi:hypothetical protein CC86DRAFT_368904 [Ophiobolus disseminans]|uniref:Uncharacterized protein n=1 Tax=Ophiobolus disseminans TaxID=1469910 RepID=A0A6A7A6H4_9PLEO|nr:hypothetical protein CC86DRAFT_368904 [Ophiobolus disseminans]
MPPPLLSRHLRPCQPSWSARHVRRASSAHVTSPPASDDKPGSKSADGDIEAKSHRGGWWRAAMASVSSFGSRTGPSELPSSSSPVASISHTKVPTTASATPAARKEPQTAPQTTSLDEGVVGEPWEGNPPVRHVGFGKSLPRRKSQAVSLLDTNSSIVGQTRQTSSRPSVESTNAAQGNGLAAVQRQIQQLFEQIRMIQETLAEKTAKPPPLVQLETRAVTSKPSLPSPPTHTSPSFQHIVHDHPGIAQSRSRSRSADVLQRARSAYRSSTIMLVRAANDIENHMPNMGASIASLLRKRLAIIARETIAERDIYMMKNLYQYKKADPYRLVREELSFLEQAESTYEAMIVRYVAVARDLEQVASSAVNPVTTKIHCQLKSLVDEAKSRSNWKLRLILKPYQEHGDDRISTSRQASSNHNKDVAIPAVQRRSIGLPRLNRGYRLSISTLAGIAQDLERITSPTSMGLARKVWDRLYAIEEDARLDNDKRMLHHMEGIRKYDRALNQSRMFETTHSPATSTTPMPTAEHAGRATTSTLPWSPPGTGSQTPLPFPRQVKKGGTEQKGVIDGSASRISPGNDRSRPSREDVVKKSKDDGRSTRRPNMNEGKLNRAGVSGNTATAIPRSSTPGHSEVPDTKQSQATSNHSDEISEQSLLEELFPEANTPPPSRYVEKRDQYSKLDLPEADSLVRRNIVERPKTFKEQVVESFQNRGEKITVLQLEHCSTELTEIDFRRLIPKGKHIEAWNRDGEFYKIIPGRDPLSLERLPFYYVFFKTPESAYAYQNNVTRLHKLAALHQPSSIFSAVPVPRGFLEDGEDVNAITKSYLLKPTEHPTGLRMIMQPYHPALRSLIDRGGYKPIVPDVDDKGNRVYKVLLHIEGYEPSHSDLVKLLRRDAYLKGMSLNLRNESSSSVHRLRDIINLKTRTLPISTTNPRAYGEFETSNQTIRERAQPRLEFDDPHIQFMMQGDKDSDEDNAKEINQMVMNRVYNRWMIEFDDEAEARRFAVQWHRRVLPDLMRGDRTWKDYEEVRMCNCEFLW